MPALAPTPVVTSPPSGRVPEAQYQAHGDDRHAEPNKAAERRAELRDDDERGFKHHSGDDAAERAVSSVMIGHCSERNQVAEIGAPGRPNWGQR